MKYILLILVTLCIACGEVPHKAKYIICINNYKWDGCFTTDSIVNQSGSYFFKAIEPNGNNGEIIIVDTSLAKITKNF